MVAGDYTVRRAINPINRIFQYKIEDNIDIGRGSTKPNLEVVEPQISKCLVPSSAMRIPGFEVYDDIICLYNLFFLGL